MAVIWKGAISFGLVHIPVTLKAAAREHRLSFDWLDRHDMAPIGYNRINKTTGKAVEWKDIVKGYEYEKGEYVVLSDEDFKRANPEATQTVEILSFVEASAIPASYFETPYYLEPDKRGKKPYALLREAMKRSGRAGLARFVVHTKQHLAALLVTDNALMLNTLRFADEIVPVDDLDLPAAGTKAEGLSAREIESATRLIADMSEAWNPGQYGDTYRDDLMARIEEKIAAGQTHVLTEPDDEGKPVKPRESAKIIDLVSLLKQSIGERGRGKPVTRARDSDEGANVGASSAAKPAAKTDAKPAAKRSTSSAAKSKTSAVAARKATNGNGSSRVAKRTIGRAAAAPAAPGRKAVAKRATTARRKAA